MLLRLTYALASLALGLTAAGCSSAPLECTLVSCQDQVSIRLKTAGRTWPNGAYTFSLRTDSIDTTCSFRLPDDSAMRRGSGIAVTCTPHLSFRIELKACTLACDAGPCVLGCDPAGPLDVEALVRDTPRSVHLSLERDGQPLVVQDVKPAYEDFFPNGRACGGECRQASVDVAVP